MKRSRVIREGKREKPNVVYWMSRDQRADDNHALLFAQNLAKKNGGDLHVVFLLRDDFLEADDEKFRFMLKGLLETEKRCHEKFIPFHMVKGNPRTAIPDFLKDNQIGCLVWDFDPLKVKRRWRRDVLENTTIPIFEVDAHNIVPCWIASKKKEFSAYTFRNKLNRILDDYLDNFGRITKMDKKDLPESGIVDEMDKLGKGKDLPFGAGRKVGLSRASYFLRERLDSYGERNDPNKNAQSRLSPYLHFGQISSQRVAIQTLKHGKEGKSFFEELVIRKELSDNFCYYEESYDSFEGFHQWAKNTLDAHRKDRREYIYTLGEFEKSKTHDELWNAAQNQLLKSGKMHGYMRMYWAKKILEWTERPEDALNIAITLNNRYELDGRDPNGYAGIAWSIGGIHDHAWAERSVFGKVRYMNRKGCDRKFNVQEYISRWEN